MKELQSETKFTQQAIDNQKTKLISEFEEWYSETFEEEAIMSERVQAASTMQTPSSIQMASR